MSTSGHIDPEQPGEGKARETFVRQLMNFADLAIHNGEQLGINVAGIRIIATFDTNDGTGSSALASAGSGNYHAQMGAVQEWLRTKLDYEHGYNATEGEADWHAINPPPDDPPDDDPGESWKK